MKLRINENENNIEVNNEDFIIRGTNLVKYIGDDTEVVIPNGVTNIVGGVFDGCKKFKKRNYSR